MSLAHHISRAFGTIASYKFPQPLQAFINNAYARAFKIDMSEFLRPSQYPSLVALFTRKLEIPRSFSHKKEDFISPSDGKILSFGKGDKGLAISVKGHRYSVGELLFDYPAKLLKDSFGYANIYLSPRDYHRYHAPANMQILSAFYVPGALYSVSEKTLKRHPDLYAKNERVVLECLLENGARLFMVFVAAINVAKMRFSFDKNIQSNAKNGSATKFSYERLFVKKGEDLGCFELGSTIVLLSEGSSLSYELKEQESVKFSQTIAKINF